MKKLLFTHSYFYRFDEKQWKTRKPYPPYGTLYAASLMRENGYDVSLFDVAFESDTSGLQPLLQEYKPDYLVIYDDGFNYLTKMCLTRMREAAFEMSKMASEAGCKVIVCSSDSTDHFQEYLDHSADFVIIGEGELTLLELVGELEKGNVDFETIAGIAFQRDGQAMKTLKRPVLRQLDDLPDPAWDLVDLNYYRESWAVHDHFFLNLATTRGCPYKCNWCAKPIYGNRYNSRSPKRVAEEIQMLVETYAVDHFWMADDIFGLKPGWVQEFRDELKRLQLPIKYKIQSRVDLLLKEDTIDALVESGLEEVWVGAESGSQKILDAMDKGTQIEQIYEATKLLKSKGVRVAFFLQFGYLGETKEDIEMTMQMVRDLLPDEIGISVSYPLPGTGFYEKVKSTFKGKENWEHSDDLDMMFEGTYGKEFYRQLHKYVHKEFRKHLGYQKIKQVLTSPFSAAKEDWRSALATAYYLPMSKFESRKLEKIEAQI